MNKGLRNPDFAFRKYVLCPECRKPLLGSSSRGKSGKYYPAYHRSNYGHYFRIPKEQFEATIAGFVNTLVFPKETIDNVVAAIESEWKRRQCDDKLIAQQLEERMQALRGEAELTIAKIKFLSSETAIQYIEKELLNTEHQIEKLTAEKKDKLNKEKPDMNKILQKVRKVLEHPEEIFNKQIDPVKKAQFFRMLFKELPTYKDLQHRTQKTPLFTGVNPVFALASVEKSDLVIPRRIELLLPG